MLAYLKLGAAIAALLAVIGAYAFGRHDGRQIEVAAHLAAASASSSAASSVRAELHGRIAELTTEVTTAEQQRQSSVREIRHETERVIERPVYSELCVDPDGVRILTTAAGIANGQGRPIPAGDASAATRAENER